MIECLCCKPIRRGKGKGKRDLTKPSLGIRQTPSGREVCPRCKGKKEITPLKEKKDVQNTND